MTDHFTDPSAPEPTDAEIEAHITSLDPVTDQPGPFSGAESLMLSPIKITALPPESQQAILAKLATVTPGNRDLFERKMVLEEATRLSRHYRVRTGLGEGATEYHRELMSIENDRRLAEEEAANIRADLERVSGYSHDVDPETGEPLAVPIPIVKGDQRSALEARYRDLDYKLSQIARESEKRLKDALGRDTAIIRQRREAFTLNAEADRVALQENRDERLATLVAAKRKRFTNNLGAGA